MLSENIKNLRKQKGLTQEELAVRLNVVRQTVSKWEKGISVPDAALLEKLADILDTNVSTLLGKIVEPENDMTQTVSVNPSYGLTKGLGATASRPVSSINVRLYILREHSRAVATVRCLDCPDLRSWLYPAARSDNGKGPDRFQLLSGLW